MAGVRADHLIRQHRGNAPTRRLELNALQIPLAEDAHVSTTEVIQRSEETQEVEPAKDSSGSESAKQSALQL